MAYYMNETRKRVVLKAIKTYREKHPNRVKATQRAYRLKSKYNLTVEDYDKLHKKQKGLCKICNKPNNQNGYNLAVDHCHKTGKIRALLCYSCNTKLGFYEKFKDQIHKYLKNFG